MNKEARPFKVPAKAAARLAKNSSIFRHITPVELKKGELRKLQIIEGTIRCLAQKGWLNTNYETVGQLCGMKRPHVAYHYPKWDDLIFSTLNFVWATGQTVVGDHLRETTRPAEQLKAYVEGTFHWLTAYPDHHAAILLMWHLATFNKRYRDLSTELKRLGTERVHAIVFNSEPVKKTSVNWKTALTLHAQLVGRCVEFMSSDLTVSAEALVSQTVEEMLRGGRLK